MRAALLVICFLLCLGIASFVADFTYNTDFHVFYYAASTILDPERPASAVYELDTANPYNVPEYWSAHFIFSLAAAYLMAPLALLPPLAAKTTIILFDILSYLCAVYIVLRLGGASERLTAWGLGLSCLWFPFIQDLRFTQINSILLLLVALAVLSATKNRPWLGGVLLGVAALFKLFPLAVAMVLGLKNWRIGAACFTVFGASFLIPGSVKWFSAIPNLHNFEQQAKYLVFGEYGLIWYALWVVIVAGLTALFAYRYPMPDYPLLAAFAIPAMFLAAPIMEYPHVTLLAFPYAFLAASAAKFPRCMLAPVSASALLVFVAPFALAGMFILWASLAWWVARAASAPSCVFR